MGYLAVPLIVLALLPCALAALSCSVGQVWSEARQLCVCDPTPGANITCGVGLCQRSVPACTGDVVSQCIPWDPPTPGLDACNGKDDDCDGLIDEDDADSVVTCGLGVCANSVKPCVGGTWVGSAWCYPRLERATPEVCNGLDDDCDGIVDNVQHPATKSCGKGRCARTVPFCTNGTETECVPGAPRDEVCNNEDDDCDGLVDEDLGHFVCSEGLGCTGVVPTCFEGRPVDCRKYLRCEFPCDDASRSLGYANCGDGYYQGCATYTRTDPHHCGACGVACPSAAPYCRGGACTAIPIPKACTTGADAFSGEPWVTCGEADAETAWVSASRDRGRLTYNPAAICRSLGYRTVTAFGGTGGQVCSYAGELTTPGSCDKPGIKYFTGTTDTSCVDDDGTGEMRLCGTTMWTCGM